MKGCLTFCKRYKRINDVSKFRRVWKKELNEL